MVNGKQHNKEVVVGGYKKLMSLIYLHKMMVGFNSSKIHKCYAKIHEHHYSDITKL